MVAIAMARTETMIEHFILVVGKGDRRLLLYRSRVVVTAKMVGKLKLVLVDGDMDAIDAAADELVSTVGSKQTYIVELAPPEQSFRFC